MKAPEGTEAVVAHAPAEPGEIGMTIVVVLLGVALLIWLVPLIAEQIRGLMKH